MVYYKKNNKKTAEMRYEKNVTEESELTIQEQLDAFVERADEFIESKYILADVKIAGLLKTIAASDMLLALFQNCLTDFDYQQARKKYLVKSQYLSSDKGEYVMPPNSRELLAFVFYVLVEIDAKNIVLGEFINKYFYVDGSFSAGYDAFLTAMIKPFRNSVKLLMESVIEGKLQDPVEALTEQENRKARQEELDREKAQKEKEMLEKTYGESLKAIKELLLEDKQKAKAGKLKPEIENDVVLVIDMLANVIESEDKGAIEYAFIAYKYVATVHKLLFYGRIKKMTKLVKDVIDGI